MDAKNHKKLIKISAILFPIVLYGLLSWLFFGPGDLSALHKDLFNGTGDPQSFVWFLNWIPYSLTHHLNPFITKFFWYPSGFNLTWATAIPSISFLILPVTILFGAVFSFNLLALLAPVLSALACFLLVFYITKKYWPAIIAGYIYGFSSYELGQLLGHANLDLTFLVPLVILVFLLRYRNRIGRNLFVALVGIIMAAQFGISDEIYATILVFSAITLVLFFFVENDKVRKKLLSISVESVFGVLLSVVLLSPMLYFMLKGYSVASQSLSPGLPVFYSADLLNFIVPTPVTLIGHAVFAKTSAHFVGNFSEEGSYLGIPLVLLLIYITAANWRKRIFKVLGLLIFIVILLALGPTLHIDGAIKGLELPENIALHLPLLKSALPDRFSLYLFMLAAIVIGLWLSIPTTSKKMAVKYTITVVAIIFILPNFSYYSWHKVHVPEVFQKTQVTKYIKRGSDVIILPYGYLGESMYYQYASGMEFTQSGGYAGFTPINFGKSAVVVSFLTGKADPNFSTDIKIFCQNNHVSKILYEPNTAKPIINEIVSLNWPTKTVGNTIIIKVP